MPQVLVVCTANICRSPVAEAILKDRLNSIYGDDWTVRSAGTWASPGQSAAQNSVLLMLDNGLDIRNHSSQTVNESLLSETDLVLCMEKGHVEALSAEFPRHRHKIYLLSEMSGRRHSVDDPYGGPLSAYEGMVAEVTDLIDAGLPAIVKIATQNERSRNSGNAGPDI